MDIYSVGHSTRSFEEFLAILREGGVTRLVDVRAFPMSRRHPQFNRDAMSAALADAGIDYHHLPALGGRRHAGKHAGPSHNTLWKVEAFRNYADYAETPAFREGLERLERLAGERPAAYMCAEALWWQCHRRLITDYLLARGWNVLHLMGPGSRQPGELTKGAQVMPDGTIRYQPAQRTLI